MILDTTSKTVEVILGAAKTTNDCEVNADFADTVSGSTFVPVSTASLTNGLTAVTVVAAPAASTQRHVKALSVYNADTVSQTVTVRSFDGTNRRRYVSVIVPVGGTLVWTADAGWSLFVGSSLVVQSGSWTPVDASGAGLALTIVHADYLKIGALVTITFDITYPVTANGSTAILTGIPFQPSTASFGFGGSPTTNTSFSRVEPSSNNLLPLSSSGGVVTNAQMSGKTLVGSVTYISTV